VTRPALHAAAGAGSLALRFLDPAGAMLLAGALALHNLLLLPRYAPRIVRARPPRVDAGVALYPLVVLAAVVCFRDRLELAACVWAILAFGDAAAAVAGRHLGGPTLPWNRDKRLAGTAAFVLAGGPGALGVGAFVAAGQRPDPGSGSGLVGAVLGATLAAALAESAASRLDDNVRIGAASIGTLAAWSWVSSMG
jgi:dolichol kinase